MNSPDHDEQHAHLVDALSAREPSVRLRAALAAGTDPDSALVGTLLARCAVEPDFFVRDMLTWALCRLPAAITVPRLVRELDSGVAQARSQALHTLSKIGDRQAWPAVAAVLHAEDDDVARSAWRAAVALVPAGAEAALASELTAALGRGDHHVHLSLSRALVALGDVAAPALEAAEASTDPRIRAHAAATTQLLRDPDSGFAVTVEMARRVAAIGQQM